MKSIWFPLLVCLVSCVNKNGHAPTYKPYAALHDSVKDTRLHDIKMRYEKLYKPKLIEKFKIDSNWFFRIGTDTETLHTSWTESNGEPIDLPHRVLIPNSALWYECEFEFKESGYLIVDGDDGSQLFLDGKRINRINDKIFPIAQEGSQVISIRVLNNAMAGGLRSVSFCSINEFEKYQESLNRYGQIQTAIEKLLLKQMLATDEIIVVENLLLPESILEPEPVVTRLNSFPLLVGPYISGGNKSGMQILVKTENEELVQFMWGASATKMTNRLSAVGPNVSFQYPSLADDADFYYRITSGQTTTGAIHVKPNLAESFTFNVWADSQGGWETFASITKSFDRNASFSVGVGDLVSNGSDYNQWEILTRILADFSSTRPFYLIAGNHDYDGYYDDLKPKNYAFFSGNSTSYFSWHHANAAFIALDPNQIFPIGFDKKQKQWFYNQLESDSWRQAKWRFIFLHQPPYSQGWPGYHGEDVVRELLDPVLELAKIDFVISGHTHDYERLSKMFGKQKVNFLIVGGAGGRLEPDENSSFPEMDVVINQHHFGHFQVEKSFVRFKALSQEGEVIDSFELSKDE